MVGGWGTWGRCPTSSHSLAARSHGPLATSNARTTPLRCIVLELHVILLQSQCSTQTSSLCGRFWSVADEHPDVVEEDLEHVEVGRRLLMRVPFALFEQLKGVAELDLELV